MGLGINYYGPCLKLNFFPIKLSTEKIDAYQSIYDKDTFLQLKDSYPESIFHKQGNVVYCIPRNKTATIIGDPVELTIRKNFSAFLRLVREGLIQAYLNTANKLVNLSTIQFIDISKNLVEPIDRRLIGIEVFSKFTVDPSFLGVGRYETLGVTIDFSTSLDLTLPLSLIDEELDLTGLYAITKRTKRLPNGVVSYSPLQGRIGKIERDRVFFSDNDNYCSASDCYLEATKTNRNFFVRYLVGRDYDYVIKKIDQKVYERLNGAARYEDMLKQARYLKNMGSIYCTDNFQFSVTDSPVEIGKDLLRRYYAERPMFIFNPAKTKTDTWHNRGLINFGPFDSEVFSKKVPRFIILHPKGREFEVNRFITLFKNGDNSKYFEKGFVKKYLLNDLQFDCLSFDLDDQNISKSYEEACLDALSQGTNYDLALIFIEERFHSFLFQSDPYLIAKSLFMSQGVPVQEIEFETLTRYGLSYSLDNIGLACYAKLGGIPWTIASPNTVDHELVIGLGTTIMRDSRLSQASRYVGITAVFGSDGNYLFSNLSNEIDYENYPDELTKSVKQIVSEVAKRQAWTKGESLRLVIHQTFKKFGCNEVNSIKDAVSEIGDFSTEFAFVNIGHAHQYTLFDLNQKDTKGNYIPERGSMITNRYNSTILTVIGSKQMLTANYFPKPLLVSVHKDSTFKDIELLTKQVYHFTSLSWRAFNPTYVPVTILYSDLIAHLMARLRTVKNWNANIIRSKLRYSRWFL